MSNHRKTTTKPLKQVFHIDFDFVTRNFSSKLAAKPRNSPERGN